MNIYELMEKQFDQQPAFILFEAMREAADRQFEKAVNPKVKEFWRLNVKDIRRMEVRANLRTTAY